MAGVFGGSNTTTYTQPELTAEQKADIAAKTKFLTDYIVPYYSQAVGGATNVYNQSAGGVNNAAQNLSGIARQAQEALGGTGESALRTGVRGLENLFGNDYEAQQLQAAMMPAQAQYQQNLAGLNAAFGGAGQIGSARQALANTQLAGQTQAAQMQAASNVLRDIQAGRLAAGQALTGAGQAGLGQAMGAAGQRLNAAFAPQQLYNQYANVLFGVPTPSYNANFAGTQGSTQNQSGTSYRIGPFSY